MAAFLRKYNVTLSGGTLIRIPIIKRDVVDYAVGADWTPSAGDVKVSKDGGAAANIGTLPSAVAMGNTAYWEFTLTGTELSAKQVVVTVADSATKAVEDQFFVVETFGNASAMYQADLSAANLPANVIEISGDSAAADNAESFFDGTGYAGTNNVIPTVTTLTNLPTIPANWLTAAGTAADFGTEIGTAVWASATRTLTAGTNVDGSTFTAIPWNASWDAEVQSEVQDALEANQLDHLIQVADPGGVVANNSFLAKLVSKSATAAFSSYDNTTDSHEAIRDRGDAAWTTATGFSTHTAADVWAVATRRVSDATNITSTGGTTVPQTGDAFARLGAPAGASVSADIAAVQADLPQRITKNTALSAFMFFMVLSSDHVTGATGKTVTATRSLDGAAFGACANAVTEVANGWYKIDLASTDLNANVVALKMTATDCDARMITLITEPT